MAMKNTDSRIALLIVIVASMLLLAGCTGTPQPVVKPGTGNGTIGNGSDNGGGTVVNDSTDVALKGCQEMTDINDMDNCYFQESLSKGDSAMCGRITNMNIRDDCFYSQALKDTKLCSQITSEMKRDTCLLLAAQTKNSSAYCNAIENETLKAECLGKTNAPCAGIDDLSNKTLCRALDKNDVTRCTDSPAPNDCMLQYAIQRNDFAACSVITNSAYGYACKAIVSSDWSYCANPEITVSRDLCYELYAFNKNDANACASTTKEFYINDCYQTMAERKKDATLCKSLYTEPARNDCYTKMALLLQDVSVCKNVLTIMNRDGCVIAVAKATANPGDCASAENDYQRLYVCCLQISTNPDYTSRLSAQGCRNINFDDSCQANCFYNVAVAQNNTALCGEIAPTASNQYMINECNKIGKTAAPPADDGYLYNSIG
ncbi:Uncharacterised protein [Candidatus Gugararchaeum adminiculabundum]|nr:Uncharacterised protein [Candidatus Gugararchaeum adminiculabundum]